MGSISQLCVTMTLQACQTCECSLTSASSTAAAFASSFEAPVPVLAPGNKSPQCVCDVFTTASLYLVSCARWIERSPQMHVAYVSGAGALCRHTSQIIFLEVTATCSGTRKWYL